MRKETIHDKHVFHEYTRGSQNARFSNRRENIADDDRDGRLKTTERVRSGIEEALNEDRRKTIDERLLIILT